LAIGALTTIDTPAASIVRSLFPFFGIGSLDVGSRIFIFGKRAAPAVGEIKGGHVKCERLLVPARARAKEIARYAPEIVFTLFGFHCDFVCLLC
jgi:hypothetical protein